MNDDTRYSFIVTSGTEYKTMPPGDDLDQMAQTAVGEAGAWHALDPTHKVRVYVFASDGRSAFVDVANESKYPLDYHAETLVKNLMAVRKRGV